MTEPGKNNKKVLAGFITYAKETAKYLPFFLPTLKRQTYGNLEILAVDNTEHEDNENRRFIKENYPEIKFSWSGVNSGFAVAYNKMIKEAISRGAEYFLALNPDMVLEPDLVEELVKNFKSGGKVGAVMPKILKLDFKESEAASGSGAKAIAKTKIIDSYGVMADRWFRFRDERQGTLESSPIEAKEIFGFTGAAVLLSAEALLDAAYENKGRKEYFDELMFMYKEDCDLSLRLRLSGWKIMLAPRAVAYHDRTASRAGDSIWHIIKNRQGKKRLVKQWSFLNQWIMLLKFSSFFSFKLKITIWWYQFKIIVFAILFEQYLLKYFFKALSLSGAIRKKRQAIKVRANIEEIEKFFN